MVCGEADMERAVHSRLRLSVLERRPREVLLLTQKIAALSRELGSASISAISHPISVGSPTWSRSLPTS
jgi:hypothetical protein